MHIYQNMNSNSLSNGVVTTVKTYMNNCGQGPRVAKKLVAYKNYIYELRNLQPVLARLGFRVIQRVNHRASCYIFKGDARYYCREPRLLLSDCRRLFGGLHLFLKQDNVPVWYLLYLMEVHGVSSERYFNVRERTSCRRPGLRGDRVVSVRRTTIDDSNLQVMDVPAPPLVGVHPNPGPGGHLHPHDTMGRDAAQVGAMLGLGALGSYAVPKYFGKQLSGQFLARQSSKHPVHPAQPLVGVELNPGPPTKLKKMKKILQQMRQVKKVANPRKNKKRMTEYATGGIREKVSTAAVQIGTVTGHHPVKVTGYPSKEGWITRVDTRHVAGYVVTSSDTGVPQFTTSATANTANIQRSRLLLDPSGFAGAPTSEALVPWAPSVSPISYFSLQYSYYRFRRLRLLWIPSRPTSDPGDIAFAYVPDAGTDSDSGSTYTAAIMSLLEDNVISNVFQPASLDVPALSQSWSYSLGFSETSDRAATRLQSPGAIIVNWGDIGFVAISTVLGRVEFEYSIELRKMGPMNSNGFAIMHVHSHYREEVEAFVQLLEKKRKEQMRLERVKQLRIDLDLVASDFVELKVCESPPQSRAVTPSKWLR
jgi:hypothetical protein